jgi:hypothetical protein
MLDGKLKEYLEMIRTTKTIFILLIILSFGCDQDIQHEPIAESGSKPGVISEIQVFPQPGGAIIAYTLPDDKDLLYVKAVYELTNGQEREVKSSFYNNYVIIEGLGDTLEHTVTLKAVNRSEVESEPVMETFKPLPPAFWETFDSLKVSPTFLGVNIKTYNPFREDLVYIVLEKDSLTGEWVQSPNSWYSGAELINRTLRNYNGEVYDTVEYEIGIILRDNWLNYSDTLFQKFTPFYEEQIPSNRFLLKALVGDAPLFSKTTNRSALWDGQITGWPNTVLFTDQAYTPYVPHILTIDMGVTAKLNRMHHWDYPEWGAGGQNVYYANGAMREFQLWGSPLASPEGVSLDSMKTGATSWQLLGHFEEIKPSGLPPWSVNNDDIEAGLLGFDWLVDENAPPMRHVRIVCLKNWNDPAGTHVALAEVQFFGKLER